MAATRNGTTLPSVYERYSDEELNQLFAPSIQVIDRLSYPLFAIIGIPGSLISAIIWSRKSMRRGSSAAAIYQASSGVVDFCYQLIFVLWYLHSAWNKAVLHRPILCEAFVIMNYWIQYLLPGLLFVFTLERYLAICHPFRSQHCLIRAGEKGAIKILSIILVICLASASPSAYFFTYIDGSCTLRGGESSNLGDIYATYAQVTELFYFFCLPLTTLLLNVLVIRVLHRSVDVRKNPQLKSVSPVNNNGNYRNTEVHPTPNGRNSEHISRTVRASTVTILCTSFYVLLVYLGYSLIILILPAFRGGDPHSAEEEIAQDPDWQAYFRVNIAKSVMTSLQNSQCAAKFPIYLATSRQYRMEFCHLVLSCAPDRCTRPLLNPEDSACQSSLIQPQSPAVTHQRNVEASNSQNSTTDCLSPGYENNYTLSRHLRRGRSGGSGIAGRRSRPSLGLTRSVITASGERTVPNSKPVC